MSMAERVQLFRRRAAKSKDGSVTVESVTPTNRRARKNVPADGWDGSPAKTLPQCVFLLWYFPADNVQLQDLTIRILHQQYFVVYFGGKFLPGGPVNKNCGGAAGAAIVDPITQAHGNLVLVRILHMLGVGGDLFEGDNSGHLIAFVRALSIGEHRSQCDAA